MRDASGRPLKHTITRKLALSTIVNQTDRKLTKNKLIVFYEFGCESIASPRLHYLIKVIRNLLAAKKYSLKCLRLNNEELVCDLKWKGRNPALHLLSVEKVL